MSKFILTLLCFISTPSFADEWTSADKTREKAYQSLAVVDWLQTINIAKHPEKYAEMNVVLGDHPSVGRVNLYFALTGIAHYLIADALPEKYRAPFQYGTIAIEVGYVAHNFSIGIGVGF